MTLTEVPTDRLVDWGGWWMPYADRIAKREGCDLSELIGEALNGEARIFVIWGKDGKPTGAVATRLLLRNNKTPIGEIHWLAGDGMSEWLGPCLQFLETTLTRDHGATAIKATGRPGWARAAKPFGYRRVKIILEKVL